jgi:hypothetical protein
MSLIKRKELFLMSVADLEDSKPHALMEFRSAIPLTDVE